MHTYNLVFAAATALLILYWNRTLMGWHAILLAGAFTAAIRVMLFAGLIPSTQDAEFGIWNAFQYYLVGIPIFGLFHAGIGIAFITFVQFRIRDQGFRLFSIRKPFPNGHD